MNGVQVEKDPMAGNYATKRDELSAQNVKQLILSMELVDEELLSLPFLSLSAMCFILTHAEGKAPFEMIAELNIHNVMFKQILQSIEKIKSNCKDSGEVAMSNVYWAELGLGLDILDLLILRPEVSIGHISDVDLAIVALMQLFSGFFSYPSCGKWKDQCLVSVLKILVDLTARGQKSYFEGNFDFLQDVIAAASNLLYQNLNEAFRKKDKTDGLNAIQHASELCVVLMINVLYTVKESEKLMWALVDVDAKFKSERIPSDECTFFHICFELFKIESKSTLNDTRKTYLSILLGSLLECTPGQSAVKPSSLDGYSHNILKTIRGFLKSSANQGDGSVRLDIPAFALQRLRGVVEFFKKK
ncbi:hypothetical protein BC829DRAFT_36434 [Chytridium lagenaria]|nr:hypothetical protein BC829DRAFT_36434 [Chytridium lagenaria]